MIPFKSTLVTALLVSCSQLFAAGGVKATTHHFEFGKLEANQNSWDYVHLRYGINDATTGAAIELPTSMLSYEVKDKSGNSIASGTGTYVQVADTKLGSEEDYTINVYATVNGEMISQTVCRKASPKMATIKLETKPTSFNQEQMAKGGFSYSFTRPKFDKPTEQEMLLIVPSEIYVEVGLQCCENSIKYKMPLGKSGAAPETAIFENTISKLVKEGQDVIVGFEPALIYKGEVYKDSAYYYEVTAGTTANGLKPLLASKE